MLRKQNDSLQNLITYLQAANPQQTSQLPTVTRWHPQHQLFAAVAHWQEQWQADQQQQTHQTATVQAIHNVLQAMGGELSFAHARTQLVEIIARATGYSYGILTEVEPDQSHMRITAISAPPLLRQRIEKVAGFSILGHRLPFNKDKHNQRPAQTQFDHVSDYYHAIPRAIGFALSRLIGLDHILYLPQRVGGETIGALTFFATQADVDRTLLQYLCDHHFIYALRLMAQSSTFSATANFPQVTNNQLIRHEHQQLQLQDQLKTTQKQLELLHKRQLTQQESFQEQTLAWQLAHQHSQQDADDEHRLRHAQQALYHNITRPNFQTVLLDTFAQLIPCQDILLLAPETPFISENHLTTTAATNTQWLQRDWQAQTYWQQLRPGQARLAFDVNEIPEWHAQKERPTPVTAALHIAIGNQHQRFILIGTHPQRGYFSPHHRHLAQQFAIFAGHACELAYLWQQQQQTSLQKEIPSTGTPSAIAALTLLPNWLANSFDAAIIINQEGIILGWNNAADNLFGWRATEARGQQLQDLILPPHLHQAYQEDLITTLQHETTTLTALHRHGQTVAIDISVTPLAADDTAAFLLFIRDLTPAHTAAEQMTVVKTAVTQLQTHQKQLLGNINHELRTPLNAIIGLSSLLLDQETAAQHHELLTLIRRSGYRLLDKFNDIFALRQFEGEPVALQNYPIPLAATLAPVIKQFTPRAQEKGLELIYFFDPTLPQMIISDAHCWQQILAYLLDNALEFTNQGQIFVALNTQLDNDQTTYVHLLIQDTGVGLPSGDHQRLFEPFCIGDESLTRAHGGLGIGLTLVRHLVTALGGTIQLERLPTQGTAVHVMLPLQPVPSTATTPTPKPFHNHHIIIATDNPLQEQTLRHYAHHWGATTAVLPIADVATTSPTWPALPDIIIIDQSNTLTNPLSHAHTMRHLLPPEITLLLLTPPHLSANDQEELALQNIICCPKPYLSAQLEQALYHCLPRLAPPAVDAVPAVAQLPPQRILVAARNRVTQNLLLSMLTHYQYQPDAVTYISETFAALRRQAYDVLIIDQHGLDIDIDHLAHLIRAQGDTLSQPFILCLTPTAAPADPSHIDAYLSAPLTLPHLATHLHALPPHYQDSYQSPDPFTPATTNSPKEPSPLDLLDLSLPTFLADTAPLMSDLDTALTATDWPTLLDIIAHLGQNGRFTPDAHVFAALCDLAPTLHHHHPNTLLPELTHALQHQYMILANNNTGDASQPRNDETL